MSYTKGTHTVTWGKAFWEDEPQRKKVLKLLGSDACKHRKNVAPASKRVKEDESIEVGRLRGVQACGLAEDSVHLFLSHVGGPLEDFSREVQ